MSEGHGDRRDSPGHPAVTEITLRIWALPGIDEIRPGDDLVSVILDAAQGTLAAGDILVVTSKIVSKAEGQSVRAVDREQAIADQTVRVVAVRRHAQGETRIVENRQGLVMAAAGVDASNTEPGTVLLLPQDPDASARRIAQGLQRRLGFPLGVIVSDSAGRAWRVGQTDLAIGAAGIRVLDDLRGTRDDHGRPLRSTLRAVADEVAAAADLVKGKSRRRPVAVVRGLRELVPDPRATTSGSGAAELLRPCAEDMFRQGSEEAWRDGYAAGAAGRPDPAPEESS